MVHTLNKNDAALIIIDAQLQLLKIMDKPISEQLIANVNLLNRMLSYWNNPIIVTEQYPKGLDPTYDAVKQHFTQHPSRPMSLVVMVILMHFIQLHNRECL